MLLIIDRLPPVLRATFESALLRNAYFSVAYSTSSGMRFR
jgi:hypothetical protein